ncbi:MAG: N-acetylmuramoyl-L-alanine amidase [Duncaniella sp.]|nr:N-acetylmuramoyl-L-alanine amidase [Duncaniella sp.]
MRRVTKIIVHCTATPLGREVSVAEVDAWHRAQGFRCIGYHYLVGLDGGVHAGRPEHEVGAHCKGQNAFSVGVAYVGGLDADGEPADTRTSQQREALRQLVIELSKRYPGATVHGHREFAVKACPCFDAAAEYADCGKH